LTNDDLVRFRQGGEICFYVKLNGLYGKGRLWSAKYMEGSGLQARIRFRLQPDGSRNVETTE
jgi:hypothetical protein